MEGRGFGVEVDVRVVGQSTQAGGVLAFQVTFIPGQFGIVAVALVEGLPVEFQVLFGVIGSQSIGLEEDADALAADGGVGQERVGTGADGCHDLGQPVGRHIVYINYAQ